MPKSCGERHYSKEAPAPSSHPRRRAPTGRPSAGAREARHRNGRRHPGSWDRDAGRRALRPPDAAGRWHRARRLLLRPRWRRIPLAPRGRTAYSAREVPGGTPSAAPGKERSRFHPGSATRASASTWRRAVPKRRCVGWRRAATSSRAGRRGRSWPAAPTASSESPAPGPGPLRGAFARSYPGAAWSATSRTVRTEEEYFLTQYVLAPLLLDRGGAHAVVVGNFFDPARAPAIAARIGLVLLADRGDETETAQGPGPLRRCHTVRSGALTSGGSCAGRRSRRSERPRPSPAPWPR